MSQMNSNTTEFRQNRRIFFNEALHKYTDDLTNAYTSATQLYSEYIEHKDFEAIAKSCEAIGRNPKHPKYLKYKNKKHYQLLEEWRINTEKACKRGNEGHDFLENNIQDFTHYSNIKDRFVNGRLYTIEDIIDNPSIGEVTIDKFKASGIAEKYPSLYAIMTMLHEKGYRFYAECTVYWTKKLVCGRIDLLVINFDKMTFGILDWKTNKAPIIFTPGYFEKDANGELVLTNFIKTNEYFMKPIMHLPASVGHKYAMQLSIYTYLVELFGFTYTTNLICQINPDLKYGTLSDDGVPQDNVKIYKPEYYKQEVIDIIDHYYINRTLKNQTLIHF